MEDKIVHFQLRMERNSVGTNEIMNLMQNFATVTYIKYVCDICNNEFTTQENLTNYKCVRCNFSYDVCEKCCPRTDGCFVCDKYIGMNI